MIDHQIYHSSNKASKESAPINPKPAILSQESSARSLRPGVFSKESSAKSLQSGVLSLELSARSAQPEALRQESPARSPQPGVLRQECSARSAQPAVLSSESSGKSPQAGVVGQESLAGSPQLLSGTENVFILHINYMQCRHLPSGTCSSPQSAASDWLVSQPPRPMDCNCDQQLLYWRTLQHLLRRSLQMATLRKLKGSAPVLMA